MDGTAILRRTLLGSFQNKIGLECSFAQIEQRGVAENETASQLSIGSGVESQGEIRDGYRGPPEPCGFGQAWRVSVIFNSALCNGCVCPGLCVDSTLPEWVLVFELSTSLTFDKEWQ